MARPRCQAQHASVLWRRGHPGLPRCRRARSRQHGRRLPSVAERRRGRSPDAGIDTCGPLRAQGPLSSSVEEAGTIQHAVRGQACTRAPQPIQQPLGCRVLTLGDAAPCPMAMAVGRERGHQRRARHAEHGGSLDPMHSGSGTDSPRAPSPRPLSPFPTSPRPLSPFPGYSTPPRDAHLGGGGALAEEPLPSALEREVAILRRLVGHPNMVQLIEVVEAVGDDRITLGTSRY